MFNTYLKKDDGSTTELDVIMIHETGIYVLESKNHSCWIFVNEADMQWTQMLPAGKGRSVKKKLYNPINKTKHT